MGLNLAKKKYEHKYGEHLTIVLKEMCSRVGATYENLNLADNESDWYHLFEWTEDEADNYKKWLIDYVYNNTKARRELMAFPHKTKKLCRKFADQFLGQFGWKFARVAELADAPDSNPGARKGV